MYMCCLNRAAKKMKCHSDDVEEKVLPDTVTEDDETIFKKPKGPRVSYNHPLPSLPIDIFLIKNGACA